MVLEIVSVAAEFEVVVGGGVVLVTLVEFEERGADCAVVLASTLAMVEVGVVRVGPTVDEAVDAWRVELEMELVPESLLLALVVTDAAAWEVPIVDTVLVDDSVADEDSVEDGSEELGTDEEVVVEKGVETAEGSIEDDAEELRVSPVLVYVVTEVSDIVDEEGTFDVVVDEEVKMELLSSDEIEEELGLVTSVVAEADVESLDDDDMEVVTRDIEVEVESEEVKEELEVRLSEDEADDSIEVCKTDVLEGEAWVELVV
ncbi:hypothetical protein ACLMJK_009159 [Lecanora helva]